jgi:predicted outer membrane repeat protein
MKLSRIYFIAFLSLINFLASSQVNIPGGYVSGYWDSALSPYIIHGNIEVHEDSLLSIGPGVEVLFDSLFQFTIRGRLMAFGNAEDSILFTTTDSITSWRGLKFYNISGEDKDTCKIHYCRFEKGSSSSGGAILADHSDKIIIDHCLILNNFASNGGGGIMINGGHVLFRNCIIQLNEGYDGGGIMIESGNATIIGCEILDNHAWIGGGIEIHGSPALIENTIIRGNSSHIMGGGITTGYGTGPTCRNVIIENNTSGVGGGIMTAYSSFWLENTTIRENWGDYAGGILIGTASSGHFSDTSRSNVYMNHSLRVQDISVGTSARLNVYLDTFTVYQPDSYLANPLTSLSFNILNAKVTGQTGDDLYLSPNGSDDNSGLSINDPLRTIEYAVRKIISSASNPPTIFLDDGIYSEEQTGEYFPIGLKNNIRLASVNPREAVIDGQGEFRPLLIFGRSGVNISGIKVVNGYSSAGGGLYISGSNIKVEDCEFLDNYGTSGGAVSISNGNSVKLSYCDFESNSGHDGGGGCHITNSSFSVIENCRFLNNSCTGGGGAISTAGTDNNIIDCLFNENTAGYGGAIYNEWYDSRIINNTFHDNYAYQGSTLYSISSNADLINSIIWDDSVITTKKLYLTSHYGAGYFQFAIDHCNLMNDTNAVQAGEFILLDWGNGNISKDPGFADPSIEDFQLSDQSPCKDAGTPVVYIYNLPEQDLAGNIRIVNDTIDMGCYENQLGVLVTDIDISPDFLVYPNPNDGHFYIRFSSKSSYLSVFDPMGKTITCNILMDRNPCEVQLKGIKPGLYFLQIQSADNIRSSKIIVRR